MLELRLLKRTLNGATALIAVASLAPLHRALAANITISAPTNATQTLGTGDSLTVTNTGSITGINPAVTAINSAPTLIDNSGTISGLTTGILIQSNADISAGVTNSGVISGGKYGLKLDQTSSITGGLTNAVGGVISGGTNGILLDNGSSISGGVSNNGTVSSTGKIAVQIDHGSSVSGDFVNNGMISAPASTEGLVFEHNSSLTGKIINNGTIAAGGSAIGIWSGSVVGGIVNNGLINGLSWTALDISSSTVNGDIVNNGTIQSAEDSGIYIPNSTINGSIINTGTIAAGNAFFGAIGLYNTTVTGPLNNSGLMISTNAGTGYWTGDIILRNNTNLNGGILNSGIIESLNFPGISDGNSSGGGNDIAGGIHNLPGGVITGKTGIMVDLSEISGGITNAGTIEGTGGVAIEYVAATGISPITITGGRIIGDVTDDTPGNGFSPVTVAGVFTTEGNYTVSSFAVNSGGNLTIGAGNSITSNSALSDDGSLTFDAGSSVTNDLTLNAGGALTVVGNAAVGGTLSSSGSLTIRNNDTLTTGSFSGNAGSDLTIEVGRSGGVLTTGELVATGSPVDLSNTGLTVALTPAFQPLTPGSTVTIAQGNAAATAPIAPVSDSSFIYDFSVLPVGNNLNLTVNQGTSFANGTVNENNATVAQVLLIGLANSTNPQINAIQNKLINDPSFSSFNHDLEATLPTVDDSAQVAAFDVTADNFAVIGDRLASLRDGTDESKPLYRVAQNTDSSTSYTDQRVNTESRYAAGMSKISNKIRANLPSGPDGSQELLADELENDDDTQTISAIGNVELVQGGSIVRADKVIYSLSSDTVSAHGHVVVADGKGDVHFADDVQLAGFSGKGFVKMVEIALSSDGSPRTDEDVAETDRESTGMSAGDGYVRGKVNDDVSLMSQAKQITPPDVVRDTPAAQVWMQGFGRDLNQGERESIAGYDSHTWGGAVGIDTRNIADRSILGASLSYGRTHAESRNANNTDTSVDSYQLTLYGDYDVDGRTFIDGMVAYGWNNVTTMRHDVGGIAGLDAHGNYEANQIVARVEADRDYTVGNTILTPDVTADAAWYNPSSYTETGAGGANLHVGGNNRTLAELGAGLKGGWIITDSSGGIFKPQVRAGYRYALANTRLEDTAQFTAGGPVFETNGPNPSRGTADLGASLRYYTPGNWNFTASYDLNVKNEFTSNTGFVKAGYKF